MAISIEATVSIVAVVLATVPICISGVKYWRARHGRNPSEPAKPFTTEDIHDTSICEDQSENHILPFYHSADRLLSGNQGTPECCKRSKGKIHVSTAHEVNLPKLNHGHSNQLT